MAMAVTQLSKGSVISPSGSLLYRSFIAANASPTVGLLINKIKMSAPWNGFLLTCNYWHVLNNTVSDDI